MGEATKAIGVLKIILFLLYFILWIYFKVNEFDSHTSKSFTINIILAFAFAFSIIFFCTEIVVLAEEEDEGTFLNSGCIIFIYLILTLAYSGAVSIGDLNAGKVLPVLISLLWIIIILSMIQIIITAKKLTYWQFFKIIKILFIIVYLIDYIIYDPHIINASTGERYLPYHAINILAVFITAILNLVFELFVMFWVNVSTDEISFAIFCKLSLILFTFIYFGAAFSNIYFLSEETYSMIDGLIWVILTSSFVETVSILGLK